MPVLCFLGVGLTNSEQTLELLTDGTCFVLVSGEESPSHGQSPLGDRHQECRKWRRAGLVLQNHTTAPDSDAHVNTSWTPPAASLRAQ